MRHKRVASSALVAAIAVALSLPLAAAANGNPHGTPPGQQQTTSPATAPAPAAPAAKGHDTAKSHTNGNGHAKASSGAAAKSNGHSHSSAPAAPQAGVKPSSTTSHWKTAPASSNQTKLYGNGKTAGQIATQAGYGNSTLLGPGNSQPHKVLCGPHMVDVHALKAHAGKCGTAAATPPAQQPVQQPAQQPARPATLPRAVVPAVTTKPVAGNAAAAPRGKGGVLGATHTSGSNGLRGVLGAAVTRTTLPFTGLALGLPLMLAFALLLGGVGMRRAARVR